MDKPKWLIEKIADDSLTYGLFKCGKHLELIETIGESFESVMNAMKELISDKDFD